MTDNTSSFKQLQPFKWFLQQMAKAPLSTRLQNNWSASRQVRQGKSTKWHNYSARWLEKGFGGLEERKSLQLLAQRKAVRQKESSVLSDTSTQNTRCSPADTHHSLVYNEQNRCLCNWSYLFYLLSFLKYTIFFFTPHISPAHNFFGEHVSHEPVFLWSVCCHTRTRAITKQMLLQRSKTEWSGLRRRVNITQQLCIAFVKY